MKTKKKLWIIPVLLLLILVVIPFSLSVLVYQQFFGIRYETYEPLSFHVEEFDGLKRTAYDFPSDRGQKLRGYLYYTEETEPKGVVVMAHGFGGGGHNSYMDCANVFAHNSYYVFAFDATGNDESEGGSVRGLPQGVIDLDCAISFVQGIEECKDLPIVLFGHSWGGYSVMNVLSFHPEVKGVVSFSGFNRSGDLLEAQGKMLVGDTAQILMPYVTAYERLLFGKYAENTAMDGFENSDAAVFVIHSEDDDTVPIEYGYDIFYEAYADSDRFTFLSFPDKGHSQIYYSEEAVAYIDAFNEEFDIWYETLPENISDEEFAACKAEYIEEHLDRTVWCDLPDEALFQQILDFYDECITK